MKELSNRKRQQRAILAWLRAGKKLTVRIGMLELGINSVPGRVYELRNEGYDIRQLRVRDGAGRSHVEYQLVEEV